eukprot:Selendium_serpulae@DN5068_c0_g1_i1.p2
MKVLDMWKEMWKFEPVPNSPSLMPYKVHMDSGKAYNWCSCGYSAKQPWCDGSHKLKAPEFRPVVIQPINSGNALMCGCKHGIGYCNGVHRRVQTVVRPQLTAAATMAFFFSAGFFHDMLFHR